MGTRACTPSQVAGWAGCPQTIRRRADGPVRSRSGDTYVIQLLRYLPDGSPEQRVSCPDCGGVLAQPVVQVVPSKDRQALAGDTEHRAELRSRLELDAHPRSSVGSRQRGAQRSISDTDALTAIEVRPAALEALVGRRADDHGQVAIGALRLRLGIPRPGPRSAVPSSIPAGICTQRLFGPHSAAARALVAGVVDDRAVSVAGGADGDLLHVRDGWS